MTNFPPIFFSTFVFFFPLQLVTEGYLFQPKELRLAEDMSVLSHQQGGMEKQNISSDFLPLLLVFPSGQEEVDH